MYFIVINPMAERGQSILRLPMLSKHFDGAGITYEVHITTGPMDGYEKTLDFCRRYPDCKGIIGVGGDGIIQEIVAGMAGAFPESRRGQKIPLPLGILPSARGNDFVSTLEGGKASAIAKYRKEPEIVVKNFFDTLIRGNLRAVDLITADGMAFLNIGHVGLDAVITGEAAALKPKYDEQAYTVATVKCIMRYKNTPLVIESADGKSEGKYTLLAVCNGQYYGGGMRIAPSAQIDDGKITLCAIKGMSRVKTFLVFPSILSEKHTRVKNVSFKECDSLKLTMPAGFLCLDGNLYPKEGEIEFKILPQVLDLFV